MNQERLTELLNTYHIVTGMEIALLNAEFHTVLSVRYPRESFCNYIHNSQAALKHCKASDMERLTAVSKTKQSLSYSCPFGITEAIAPIVRDERILGYLISTIGIPKNKSQLDDIPESIILKLNISTAQKMMSDFKRVSEAEVQAHVNMLAILAEHIAADPSLTNGNESIGTLIKYYIKQNIDKKISLSDIAYNLHYSTVTVTEHFKQEFEMTIVEYVTKKRMELAQKLLISTDEPLHAVAAKVGYSDVGYFSRSFKRYFGTPPALWRRRNKETAASMR